MTLQAKSRTKGKETKANNGERKGLQKSVGSLITVFSVLVHKAGELFARSGGVKSV